MKPILSVLSNQETNKEKQKEILLFIQESMNEFINKEYSEISLDLMLNDETFQELSEPFESLPDAITISSISLAKLDMTYEFDEAIALDTLHFEISMKDTYGDEEEIEFVYATSYDDTGTIAVNKNFISPKSHIAPMGDTAFCEITGEYKPFHVDKVDINKILNDNYDAEEKFIMYVLEKVNIDYFIEKLRFKDEPALQTLVLLEREREMIFYLNGPDKTVELDTLNQIQFEFVINDVLDSVKYQIGGFTFTQKFQKFLEDIRNNLK